MCFTGNNNSESKRAYGYPAVAVKQPYLQECLYLRYMVPMATKLGRMMTYNEGISPIPECLWPPNLVLW